MPVEWFRHANLKLEDRKEIEQYLTTFKQHLTTFGQIAIAYCWPKEAWVVIIVSHLSRKAHADHALDYDHVNEAILHSVSCIHSSFE